MKQLVLERARSAVDAFLRNQCADIALEGAECAVLAGRHPPDFAIHMLMKVRADA